jgi:hypothetical protein
MARPFSIQAIVEMARSVDSKGERTIGVLTKPDTIEAGTHDQWLPVLTGDKFSLSLGYYAVRNMSQEDLNKGMSLEVGHGWMTYSCTGSR